MELIPMQYRIHYTEGERIDCYLPEMEKEIHAIYPVYQVEGVEVLDKRFYPAVQLLVFGGKSQNLNLN